jgi:hypothetical protein
MGLAVVDVLLARMFMCSNTHLLDHFHDQGSFGHHLHPMCSSSRLGVTIAYWIAARGSAKYVLMAHVVPQTQYNEAAFFNFVKDANLVEFSVRRELQACPCSLRSIP